MNQHNSSHCFQFLLELSESPDETIEMAHVVGSTSQLLKASMELPNSTFIVATDRGIFYKMEQNSPHKKFIPAMTGGEGASCKSCSHCPWMGMNGLRNLASSLENEQNEISIDPAIIEKALVPLERMVNFKPGQA